MSDSGGNINLILEAISSVVSIDTAAFCIVKLAMERKDGVVEITDLGLHENELVGLEH